MSKNVDRDLEIEVKSQSRSLKVVPLDRLSMFFSNFVPKRTGFEIFDLELYSNLETLVCGFAVTQGYQK